MSEKNDKSAPRRSFLALPPYTKRLLKRRRLSATLPVLVMLCAERDFDTDQVSLSLDKIGEDAGVGDARYVRSALAELHALGVIRTIRAGKPGRGNRAVWHINLEAEPWGPQPVPDAPSKTCGPGSQTPALERGSIDHTPSRERGYHGGDLEPENQAQTPSQNPAQTPAQDVQKPGATPRSNKEVISSRSSTRPADTPAGFGEDGDAAGGLRPQPRREAAQRAADEGTKARRRVVQELDRWATLPVAQGGRKEPGNSGQVNITDPRDINAISELVAHLLNGKPILHAGREQSRMDLLPRAVDALITKGKPFKHTAFACGCVRGQLDDLARGHANATNGAPVKQPGPPVQYGRRMS